MQILILGLIFVVNGCIIPPQTIKCDEGWIPIQRKLGLWCAKIVQDANFNADCTQQGGTFSSIESETELNIYLAEMRTLGYTYAYLGSSVTDACNCYNVICPITANCTPPNVWEWTDGFTVGTTLMSLVQEAQLAENKFGVDVLLTTTTQSGLTDNADLSLVNLPFVCGKKAV